MYVCMYIYTYTYYIYNAKLNDKEYYFFQNFPKQVVLFSVI